MHSIVNIKLLNSLARKTLMQIKSAGNYHIPKGAKNYRTQKECLTVYDYLIDLIEMPNGRDIRIEKFWLDIIDDGDKQNRFLHKLASDSRQWLLHSTHYVMPSEFPISLDSLRKHLKAIKLALKKLPYLEAQINDDFSSVLETQFEDYTHDELGDPDWHSLTFESVLDSLEATLGQRRPLYPNWYPRKMKEPSADRTFAVRVLSKTMKSIDYSATHDLIADMASLLSRSTINAEDVRATLRKQRSQKIK